MAIGVQIIYIKTGIIDYIELLLIQWIGLVDVKRITLGGFSKA